MGRDPCSADVEFVLYRFISRASRTYLILLLPCAVFFCGFVLSRFTIVFLFFVTSHRYCFRSRHRRRLPKIMSSGKQSPALDGLRENSTEAETITSGREVQKDGNRGGVHSGKEPALDGGIDSGDRGQGRVEEEKKILSMEIESSTGDGMKNMGGNRATKEEDGQDKVEEGPTVLKTIPSKLYLASSVGPSDRNGTKRRVSLRMGGSFKRTLTRVGSIISTRDLENTTWVSLFCVPSIYIHTYFAT